MHSEADKLLPEEQWAQITMKIEGIEQNGQPLTQYGVFERRLADKLSYMDWKVALLADGEEYLFMH